MFKIKKSLFVTIVVISLSVLLYFFNSKIKTPSLVFSIKGQSLKTDSLVSEKVLNIVKTTISVTETQTIKKFLNQEVALISGLDSSASKSLRRLKNRAALLTESDFKYLLQEVLDVSQEGDRRFLSVYLLSFSQNILSANYLAQIVSTPISKNKLAQRLYEQELVIRMKAVEGFVKVFKTRFNYKKKIEQLLRQQENPFLVKFIRSMM